MTPWLLAACSIGYNVEKPVLDSGGLKVNNLLYTPGKMAPGVKYPGVVINHGGMGGVEFATKGWARVLARKGYVVILPQFRGQGGSGGHFEFAGGEVDDGLAALRYLEGLGYVDHDRIGMVGYSLGGLVTLLVLERTGEVKAAVVVSSLSDPLAFFEDASRGAPVESLPELERIKKEAESRSPYPEIGKIGTPLLILHGDRDARVKPEQSRRLYETLKASGKDVRLIIYPGMGHGMMWNAGPMTDAIGYLDERLKR